MNWDNLRYVLSVAEHGSIADAARELGVNRTTVARRIHAFEKSINVRVFEHIGAEYVLTSEAQQLLEAARHLSGTINELERKIAGSESKLEGELRVTTTDSMLITAVGDAIASFGALHPNIHLELIITNSRLDLMRRDADVAIRPSLNPPELLVGRQVCRLGFGLYASPEYLRDNAGSAIADHRWLGLDGGKAGSPPAVWLDRHVSDGNFIMRGDSFLALQVAAEQGLGLTILPCPLGDSSPRLTRLAFPDGELFTHLWILTHKDLRGSARVRAFTEHCAAELKKNRDVIEGLVKPPSADFRLALDDALAVNA